MVNKNDLRAKGFVSMTLPYGSSRREIRNEFARLGNQRPIYDNDFSSSAKPSADDVAKILAEMSEDEALILLGSNAFTLENELLAYVIFTAGAWDYLLGPGYVMPKVLKKVPWRVAEYRIIG